MVITKEGVTSAPPKPQAPKKTKRKPALVKWPHGPIVIEDGDNYVELALTMKASDPEMARRGLAKLLKKLDRFGTMLKDEDDDEDEQ